MKLLNFSARRRDSRRWSARRAARLQPIAAQVEYLEARVLLSAAFDLVGLTAMRSDPIFAQVDGSGVGIAVIDTGLFAQHPDIQGNFVAWFDAVGTDAASDGVVTPADTNPANAFDPHGHGTHVAGTVASSNREIGVAPEARLIGIRGLLADGERHPNHNPVLSGLRWVEENHATYNIRVVNMSLGNHTNFNALPREDDYARQIDRLEELGIAIVAASGNSYAQFHTLGASAPAAFASLNVANTWEDSGVGDRLPSFSGSLLDRYLAIDRAPTADQLAASSQRSTLPNQVAAPGSTIYSAWNGTDGLLYNTTSGTSMASPLVAGMVALMQDAAIEFGGRYLATDEVVDIVRSTADRIVDSQNPNTSRRPFGVDAGRLVWTGPLEDLIESGQTFLRVNIQHAVRTVRDLVTRGGTPSPDPDPGQRTSDTNNTISTATHVPVLDATEDFTLTGAIGRDGQVQVGTSDVDLFRLVLEAPAQLRILMEPGAAGQNLDPVVRLFDSAGTQIDSQDDRAPGELFPDLRTAPLRAGTYYLGISSYANFSYDVVNGQGSGSGFSAGDYTVTIIPTNPDPNGVIQGAVDANLTSPSTFNANQMLVSRGVYVANYFPGLIDSDPNPLFDPERPNLHPPRIQIGPTDVDMFKVVAPDTGSLFVDIDAQSVYGLDAVDSYVEVYDLDSGALIAVNDDYDGLDSFLEVSVQIGRTYIVAVTTFGNRSFDPLDPYNRSSTTGEVGLYDLYLSFTNGDVNGTAYGALDFTSFDADGDGVIPGTIGADFGQPLSGANGGFKDVDFLFYTAPVSAPISFSVTSADGSLRPVLGIWELGASDIHQVASTAGQEPSIVYQVSAGQTILVSVAGEGNSGFNWFAPASGSGGDTGNYELSVRIHSQNDIRVLSNDSIGLNTPTPIEPGQRIAANIGVDGGLVIGGTDIDLYTYTSPRDQSVVIRTFTTAEDSADTFLRVFDALGREIAFNNNADSRTTASSATVSLRAGQTYYIGVNGASEGARNYDPLTGGGSVVGSRGNYELSVTPVATSVYVTGAGAGGNPDVRVFDAATGNPRAMLFAFTSNFRGGVRVATGDVNGDGEDEIIAGAGASGGPAVRVIDGATGIQIGETLFAFARAFRGGVTVAAGDVNGDGRDEIIVGAGAGGGPAVRVFDGVTGAQIGGTLFAFPRAFRGGVTVAAGDVNGDGRDEIIVGAGAGGGPAVRVFDGLTGAQIGETLFAFPRAFRGGVTVAAGDADGDRGVEIIVGAGPGGGPAVRVFHGTTRVQLGETIFPYSREFRGGVWVAGNAIRLQAEGSSLRVEGSIARTPGAAPVLSEDDLWSVVIAARVRLENAGVPNDLLSRLASLQFVVTDLGSDRLGRARPGQIYLDDDAAGFGWFVDYSPLLDEEFFADGSQLVALDGRAAEQVDLLTAVLHEFGHALGLHHRDFGPDCSGLMTSSLGTGVRRLPSSEELDELFAGENAFEPALDLP